MAALNRRGPGDGHQRRSLTMSQHGDGTWVGKFSCGPAEGLLIKRAIAAGAAPRPGKAIDADGVEHDIPDRRDLAARQFDAAYDLITLGLARTGITLPTLPTNTHTHTDTDSNTFSGNGDVCVLYWFRRIASAGSRAGMMPSSLLHC